VSQPFFIPGVSHFDGMGYFAIHRGGVQDSVVINIQYARYVGFARIPDDYCFHEGPEIKTPLKRGADIRY